MVKKADEDWLDEWMVDGLMVTYSGLMVDVCYTHIDMDDILNRRTNLLGVSAKVFLQTSRNTSVAPHRLAALKKRQLRGSVGKTSRQHGRNPTGDDPYVPKLSPSFPV